MGCSSVNSNAKEPIQIRIKPRISAVTISTLPLSAVSRAASVYEPKCLKFRIKEENIEEWEFNTAMLAHFTIPCLDQIMLIYEKYHNYQTVLSLFESSVHGVCIPNYDVLKGVHLLIIYLRINNFPKSKITVTKKFPYLNLQDELGEFHYIIMAYADVIRFLKEFSCGNPIREALLVVKSFLGDSMLESIQQTSKQSKSIMKTLNKILKLGYETNSAIEKMMKGLEEFSISLPKLEKEIDKKAIELRQFKGESIETIVHKIFIIDN